MTPRTRLLIPLVIIPLLAGLACGQARGPVSPVGWIEHKDALGFTVRHPQGWQVDASAQNLILVRAGDGTGWILAHPFLLQKPSSSSEWLAQSPGQFASVLPQAKVVRSVQRSQKPDEALASVQFVREGAPWQATLLCSIQGRAGMLYGIAAPAAQFAARRALLVQVLQTLKFTQPSAKPGAAAEAQYVRWQDPREGAFSVEVPQGWRVDGGMFRFSTASRNGRPVQGYLFSGTLLVSGQGSGLWQVPFLHGFIASPEQTGAAQAALERLIRSIQVNPAWAQRQQGAVAETSRIVSETNAYVTKVIEDGYWAREQSRSELSRKWSNVTLGQTDVADPETGERWKVASGHNYYWRQNYTDNVAGTNVYDAPDINFSPLVEY